MLQCYVLMCGRLVTAFLAPPRGQRVGKGPTLPTQRLTLYMTFITTCTLLQFCLFTYTFIYNYIHTHTQTNG
jgi:hypothetical protein